MWRSWRGRAAVHPRVCGELDDNAVLVALDYGSSPRVRGTRSPREGSQMGGRFIPACAGNSASVIDVRARMAVHPRVCGELLIQFEPRFIPACAGNSGACRWRMFLLTVHPRVCGELAMSRSRVLARTGSSPRVRGTPQASAWRHGHWRFIPACAGNSRRGLERVHESAGSSPRVRGTRPKPPKMGELRRFIPACAGNSGCGEQDALGSRGSSPRVRGTPSQRPRRLRAGRFIPACAGNSPARWPTGAACPVHPRVCGELLISPMLKTYCAGSSPRVRGTRLASSGVVAWCRFIPACAGNSRCRMMSSGP